MRLRIFVLHLLLPFFASAQLLQHASLELALEPILNKIHQDPATYKQLQQLKSDFSSQLNDYESLYLEALIAESLLNIDDKKALNQAIKLEHSASQLGYAEEIEIVTIFEIIKIFHATRRYEYKIVGQIGPNRLKMLNPNHRLFGRIAFYTIYANKNISQVEIDKVLDALKKSIHPATDSVNARARFYYYAAMLSLDYDEFGISEKAFLHYENLRNTSFKDDRVFQISLLTGLSAYLDLAQFDYSLELVKKYDELSKKIEQDNIDLANNYISKSIIFSQLDDQGINPNTFIKKAIEAIESQKEEAPLVYCKAQLQRVVFLYRNQKTRQLAKPIAQSLLKKFPDNIYVKEYIAFCNHHAKNYDEALLTFQSNLQKIDPSFTSDDIFQNPTIEDKLYKKYTPIIYILAWKSRSLYKKSMLIEDNRSAIKYLNSAIETAELSIQFLDSYIEAKYPYYFSSFFTTRNQHTTYNLKIRMHHELYQRTNDIEQLNLMLYNIERAKNLGFREPNFNQESRTGELKTIDSLMAKLQLTEVNYQNLGNDAQLSDLEELYRQMAQLDNHIENYRSTNKSAEIRPAETRIPSIQELQSALQKDQSYITIQEKWGETYAMFISKDTVIAHKYIFEEGWGKALRKLNRQLQSPMQVQQSRKHKILTSAHDLYKKILLPFETELQKSSKVVISPDEDLYYLPFEVLLPKIVDGPYSAQPFLIKTHEFQYQYSVALFIKNQQRKRINDKSVLAFAPVFDNGSEISNARSLSRFGRTKKLMRGMRNDKFTPLPYTKEEVSAIAQIMQSSNPSEIFLNENANKAKFIKALEAKPYQYIHIATHGFVNYYNPFLCAIACYKTTSIQKT